MKDYIIDCPQLQSRQKRAGAMFASMVCWLMWIYLLSPLIVLSSRFLAENRTNGKLSWLGDEQHLLQLLAIYSGTLFVLLILWLGWIFCRARCKTKLPIANETVDDAQLCRFYQVQANELKRCRKASITTVYFDGLGRIVRLEPADK